MCYALAYNSMSISKYKLDLHGKLNFKKMRIDHVSEVWLYRNAK